VAVDSRTSFLALILVCAAATASAQPDTRATPRRHFVTVSYDSLYTQPLHFANHPLGDLLGVEVAAVHFEQYDYRTRDERTLIDVIDFSRRSHGASVSLYPLGMASGPALMLRGSVEPLPAIRIAFEGPAPFPRYELTDGRALDASAGVIVADRSPGWGLGSHAFVAGGIGRLTSSMGEGRRYFAEGGGGVGAGPFGVELGVKFAWNTLHEPVTHRFLTVPITLRGTLTF
jgi:hypothetical protein